jgi:hypothetical protein
MVFASRIARSWSTLNVAAWSKVGNLDVSVAALAVEDTQDRLPLDHNSAHPRDQAASKEVSVDVVVLVTEVGSVVASMTEVEASVDVEASEVIEVGMEAEEVLATRIAGASRMAHHPLAHQADLAPKVALDLAHRMVATTTEAVVAMVEAIDVEEEVAMTPETLVVSVAAIAIRLETAGVGIATVIDTATDLDETTTTDQENEHMTAISTKIQDKSGGIEHHIPMRFVGGYLCVQHFDFYLVPSASRVRKVLHYYQQLSKASAKALWCITKYCSNVSRACHYHRANFEFTRKPWTNRRKQDFTDSATICDRS